MSQVTKACKLVATNQLLVSLYAPVGHSAQCFSHVADSSLCSEALQCSRA